MSKGVSPGQGKVCLQIAISKNTDKEKVIFTLNNMYYLLSSPSNFVSLALLNNNKIYYDNKNEIFYDSDTKEILVSTQLWRKNFFLKLLNLFNVAVYLSWADEGICKGPYVYQTVITLFLLLTWYKQLRHLNFVVFRKYLNELGIPFIDDGKYHICDSYQQAKTTKIYNQNAKNDLNKSITITLTRLLREYYFFIFTDS